MLEVRDLNFSYDGTSEVLSSLNFTLEQGEIVVIAGSTGSGKSTMAKCLSGFIPHFIRGEQSGTISVNGHQYENMKMPEIARQVSLVQQDSENQICTLKVIDEIAFGPENYSLPPDIIEEEISRTLEAVGAAHLSDRTTYALSGGEKQRIAIASILACMPEYIIFDEPTSSLDPKGIMMLREVLVELRKRRIGILVIEHNLEALLPIADRILALSDGKLVPFQSNESPIVSPQSISHREEGNVLVLAENIGFSYGRRRAVEDVSLAINGGEIIALMGDNGSGKSTVLGMLSGLLPSESGSILFSGAPINKLDRRELGREIAVVFQNPNHQIFEQTVAKDQSLAIDLLELGSDFTQKSKDVLRESGLADFQDMNPFSLSYGQKRRLNISATCFFEPILYFLDEPFIGQDRDGQDFIIEKMIGVAQRGGATILVTHNSKIAVTACTRIIFMEKGRILLDGPPSTVLEWLAANGYEEYVNNRGANI